MGTWGPGNFDSDYALDFLSTEVRRHVTTIDGIMADAEAFQLDEDAESVLMPTVAILVLLCKHCHALLPRAVNVQDWQTRYLAMYDRDIDGLEPKPDFKAQRRAVIIDTFERLQVLNHERGTSPPK